MAFWDEFVDEVKADWTRYASRPETQQAVQYRSELWAKMSPEERMAYIRGGNEAALARSIEGNWVGSADNDSVGPGAWAAGKAIQGLAWTWDNAISQPISTAALLASSQGLDDIQEKGWKRAASDTWTEADHISPAQAMLGQGSVLPMSWMSSTIRNLAPESAQEFLDKHARFLSDDFDVRDEADRENAFKEQVVGKLESGVGDTIVSFVADPFIIGGVALKAGRTAKLARPAAREKYVKNMLSELDEYDAWKAAGGSGNAPNGMGQVVENVVNMNARQVRKYIETAGSRSNDPELVAQVLGSTTDPLQTSNIFRVFFGDSKGVAALKEQRADLAAMIERNRAARERMVGQVQSSRNDYWEGQDFFELDQKAIAATDAEFASLVENDNVLRQILDQGQNSWSNSMEATAAKWAWVERARARKAIRQESAEVGGFTYDFYQPNRFARGLISVRQRGHDLWRGTPSGYVNTKGVGAVNSAEEIVAALRDVRVFDDLGEVGVAKRRELIDHYLAASTSAAPDVARARAVEDIERSVAEEIIRQHGVEFSADQIDEIMASFSRRRAKLVEHVRQKGYWVDEDGNFVTSPVVDTQLANGVPMLNFREFERAVKRVKEAGGLPKNVDKIDVMVHWNNVAQQLWRPAVLFRIGYPIRNVGESTARAWTFLDSVTEMYSDGALRQASKNFSINMGRRGRKAAYRLDPKLRLQLRREGYRGKTFPKVQDYLSWQQHKISGLQANANKAQSAIDSVEKELTRLKGMLKRNQDEYGEMYFADRNALQDRVLEMERRLDGLYELQYNVHGQVYDESRKMADVASKFDLLERKVRSGEGYDEVLGYRLPQPFNPDFEINRAARANASSDSKWEMVRNGSTEVDELNLTNSDWGSAIVVPGDPHYFVEASEVLNRQVRNSELWRRWFLRNDPGGEGSEGVLRWLMSRNPEADKVRMFHRIETREDALAHIENMDTMVRTTFPDDDLLRYALDNEVDSVYLRQWAARNPELVQPVHGRQLGLTTGANPALSLYQKSIRKLFRLVGSLPEDTLIREPFYAARFRSYRDQVVRAAYAEGRQLSVADINRITAGAHKRALRDLKKNIYTIERYSNFARTAENILPFIMASENAVRTWGRLWANNPKALGIMYWAWNAPDRNGLVINGETGEHEKGWSTNPFGTDQYAMMGLPKWFTSGLEKYTPISTGGQDNIYVSKQSFNTILQMPGFGPLVTWPVNFLADMRPPQSELEDRLYNMVMPYGASKKPGNWDVLMGGWQIRLAELMGQEEDYSFSSMAGNIARTEHTRYMLGERDLPTTDEIIERTRELYALRTLSQFTLPMSVQFKSPYDGFRIEYRNLVDEYGFVEGEQRFYDYFGDDYAMWTAGTSESNAGMNPVTEAAKFYEQHGDLVDKVLDESQPEFVQFITNTAEQSNDPFSQGVWGWQFVETIGSGGKETLRTQRSAADVTAAGYESLGWHQYEELTNDLELVAQSRGLSSMTEDPELTAFRSAWVAKQQADNHWFYDSYHERNDAKSEQAVRALAVIVSDEKFMAARGEEKTWEVVGTYLEARNDVAAVLQARDAAGGSASLDAVSNQDVVEWWSAFTGGLTSQDATFAMWYDRYLANDPLVPIEVG